MKTINKCIAFILVAAIFFCNIPLTFAEKNETGFVKLEVALLKDEKTAETREKVFYFDGTTFYAPVKFFSEYTLYSFDEENKAFVRMDQAFADATSKITVDFENKTATVTMLETEETIPLENVYTFGSIYYLPLAQTAALLKARTEVDENNTLWITNSGISLADATYGFKPYLLTLNDYDIIDGIFAGSEKLYFTYCIIGFYGSTIFGLRYKNLDFITKSGDTEYYEEILTDCVTNMDEYLSSQSSPDTFLQDMKTANITTDVIEAVIGYNNKVTTIKKAGYEIEAYANNILPEDIEDFEYVDYKEFSGFLGKLSTALDWLTYAIRLASLTEDHREMLEESINDSTYKRADKQIQTALDRVYGDFGNKNVLINITHKAFSTMIEEFEKEIITEAFNLIVPHLKVIKAVNAAFHLLGFDIDDNTQYSILLESLLCYHMKDRYNDYCSSAGEDIDSSEKFRKSAVFWLLTEKHAYSSGNKLNKKIGGKGTMFDDELKNVSARLSLFYLAAESSQFDSIEQCRIIAKDNLEELNNISFTILSSEANIYTEDDYINYFEDEVIGLIDTGYTTIFESDGYAFSFPFSMKADYHNSQKTYIDISWGMLLEKIKNDPMYYDECVEMYSTDLYASEYGMGNSILSVDFLSENDKIKISEFENAFKGGNTWFVMKNPDLLQQAADSILGKGRIDIRDALNTYKPVDSPAGFVGENDYCFYLGQTGFGDAGIYSTSFRIKDIKVENDHAVLSVSIIQAWAESFFETLFGISQIVKSEESGSYEYKNLYYSENSLSAQRIEELMNSGYEAISTLEIDENEIATIDIVLYNTDDGIRLWDIDAPYIK